MKIIKYKGVLLEVHENGDVYSLPFTDSIGRKLRRAKKSPYNKGGYRNVGIYCRDSRRINTVGVHRLVAQAFLDDFSDSLNVDHINLDKSDNNLSNLRMVTPQENVRLFYEQQSIKDAPRKKSMPNGFKGVSKARAGRFMAQIRVNGRRKFNGNYDRAIDAAMAVNQMCLEHGLHISKFNTPLMAKKPKSFNLKRCYANHYL